MSKKNGIDISWSQWSKYTGSVFCAEFGTDIGMAPIFAPGALGTHQLQVTGTFQNINQSASISPTFYMIIIYEGTISSMNGTVVQQTNVLTNEDCVNAVEVSGVTYKHSESVYGGNFFSDLVDIGKKVWSGVKTVATPIRAITGLIPHPYAQGANRVLSALGAGMHGVHHRLKSAMRSSGSYPHHGPVRHRSSSRMHGSGFDDSGSYPRDGESQSSDQQGGYYQAGYQAGHEGGESQYPNLQTNSGGGYPCDGQCGGQCDQCRGGSGQAQAEYTDADESCDEAPTHHSSSSSTTSRGGTVRFAENNGSDSESDAVESYLRTARR
jgi:hypothetical protein